MVSKTLTVESVTLGVQTWWLLARPKRSTMIKEPDIVEVKFQWAGKW
jgi:hypothetical protein